MFDLAPAGERLARVVTGVRDDQLGGPTPCQEWTVGDLLAHVHQFVTVFTQNARKEPVQPPQDLVPEWRVAIPEGLDELTRVWREESAWQGQVSAGGVEMPASDNAVVAVEELTVHGWDLARATGQPFEVDDPSLDVVDRFFKLFAGQGGAGDGPFGPKAAAPDGATRLERTIARTGRDPLWAP